MKRIIVNVPDKKLEEFLKLMTENGYKTQEEDFEIPEWHKELVLERIRTAKEEDYIPWEQVKKNLGIK